MLPNHLHKPFTLRAAAAGKHVWCEKSMAMDAAEARAMIDACRQHRVQLAIGYRMQHEPNTQAVMALAESRPFGRLWHIRAEAGCHGFACASRDQVDAFHAAALAAGGRDNGAPGLRPWYHPDYYGAFVLDPDGNNIEAVCHRPAAGVSA